MVAESIPPEFKSLIIAAPHLLDACQKVLAMLQLTNLSSECEILKTAIDKAKNNNNNYE